MTPRSLNAITRWVVVGPFLLWGAWELVLLVLRRSQPEVRLVSQAALALSAKGLPSLAYAMTGLSFHFFQTWRRPPWTGATATTLAVIWWVGLAVYLANDALVPEARTWFRYPPIAMALGGLGAWLCFPQSSLWTP